jgi:sugar phosphate isomerase/epimerase
MPYTRREAGKLALSALPAIILLPGATPALTRRQKPNSKFAGVQVGLNVPYNFGNQSEWPAERILKAVTDLGVSGVELRAQPIEIFAGAAKEWVYPPTTPRGQTQPPDQAAARKQAAADLTKWRLAAPMAKVRDLKKMYDEAGVQVEIVKVDGLFGRSDEELDYSFTLAKAMGARAISTEISQNQDDLKRAGRFADKHQLMVGYHGHTETGPADWEQAFSYAKFNGANLDIGHFVGGQKTSPVPFLKQHHSRITHLHIKDKTLQNANVPFGQGDTPIKETLQLLRDNKWPIQATIEFEYPVPAGSDRMAEMAKCVQFCRDCLV